jgi:hypothetical protein
MVCGLDWSGSGWGQVESSCECGNESSGSIKTGNLSSGNTTGDLLCRAQHQGVSLVSYVFSTVRPSKPPPPPRNQSLDAWGKTIEGLNKPARPPPPKSAELLWQQKQPARQTQLTLPVNNVYANLGGYSMW